MQPNGNPLSKYPIIPVVNLHNWTPNPQPFFHYEKYNENYGTLPSASISLRQSDMAMCMNTNGYLSWWCATRRWPNRQHMSWFYSELLLQCNKEVRESSQNFQIKDDENIVIPFSSIYCDWNQGHDLSVLVYTYITYLKTIEKFPDKKVYVVVSEQTIPQSKNSTDLLYILFPIDRIIRLKTNVVYKFNNYVTPPSNYFHLKSVNGNYGNANHDEPLVNKTLNYIIDCVKSSPLLNLTLQPIIDDHKGKFVLVKTSTHKAARREGIVPDDVLDSLTELGWYVINPEKLSLVQIIYLLSQATEVILGSGSIQYTHRYFINREAQIYSLFNSRHNYCAFVGQRERNLKFAETNNKPWMWNNLIEGARTNTL